MVAATRREKWDFREEGASKPDQWAEAMKQVKVSGMSRMGNSGFFAVVNGRTVTKGIP
jgi:hypothetical protein